MSSYTPEQIRDNRQRFLAALRRGSYKQGNGWLRTNDDGYCCLGVACDVLDPHAWARDDCGIWVWDNTHDFLPARAIAGYGLGEAPHSHDPFMDADGMTASALNDNLMLTFPYIADRFEELFAKHPVEDDGATTA